jgi:hypothetical protein
MSINPTRCRSVKIACWISWKGASRMGLRAMRMRSFPGERCLSRGWIAARICRFARFLSTAPPRLRPADTATRDLTSWFSQTTNTISGWATDFPRRLTRLKSADFLSRNLRFTSPMEPSHAGKPSAPDGLSVPVCFLDVIILRHSKAIATFQSAAFEDFTTPGTCHPASESMYAHPATYFWLIGSFRHK